MGSSESRFSDRLSELVDKYVDDTNNFTQMASGNLMDWNYENYAREILAGS